MRNLCNIIEKVNNGGRLFQQGKLSLVKRDSLQPFRILRFRWSHHAIPKFGIVLEILWFDLVLYGHQLCLPT